MDEEFCEVVVTVRTPTGRPAAPGPWWRNDYLERIAEETRGD